MEIIKQSDPRNTERRIYFTCVDAASVLTYLQASDMSTFTVKLSKNGATAASTTNSPVEVDATNQKGLFYVELTAAELNTVGKCTIVVTNTAGTKTMLRRDVTFKVTTAFWAVAATGTLSATAFSSDRTEGTNYWMDALVLAVTGTLAGQVKKVGAFATTGGIFTLATNNTFTGGMANGDIFEILDR